MAYAKMLFVYDKLLDDESGMFYYFNNRIGEAEWVKPLPHVLFGDNDLPLAQPDAAKPSPREVEEAAAAASTEAAAEATPAEAPKTDDEAAIRIQCMYRCWVARERVFQVAQTVYEKVSPTNLTPTYNTPRHATPRLAHAFQ